jgi:hypothetical protein
MARQRQPWRKNFQPHTETFSYDYRRQPFYTGKQGSPMGDAKAHRKLKKEHIMPTLRSARLQHQALCLIGAALFASAALAAGKGAASQADAGAKAQYQADVAHCKAGQSNQDRATCLKEAGAALVEARRNQLSNGPAAYDQDKLKRCQALPASQQQDCITQMSGQDTQTEGNALSGGVLRQTTITVPTPPSALPGPATQVVPGTSTAPIR